MAQVSVQKVERLENQLAGSRRKLREGARIGSNSLIGGLGGGIASGFLEAKYPKILGTEAPTNLVAGLVLVGGSLAQVFDDRSDEIAALGSGMLAASISRIAEKFFWEA